MKTKNLEQISDQERFEHAILKALEIGGFESLLRGERERGYTCVFPGQVDWLSSADWLNDAVVSLDQRTVRIVAIRARQPGTGAFRRLIERIIKSQLSPMVIEPMLAMPVILARWGWSSRMVGDDFDSREEQWYPCALLSRATAGASATSRNGHSHPWERIATPWFCR